MKEMQAFARQYEELAKKCEKLEEIGCIELTEIKNDLANLQSKMRLGGEEISESIAHNRYDLNEFTEAINLWRTTDNKIDELVGKVDLTHTSRWEFTQSKFSEYKVIKDYRRENQKRINEFKFQLDKHKAALNHNSDPFARDNMEETIRDDEKHIQRSEELGEKYDEELSSLANIIDKLLHGGKVPAMDRIDVEDILDELEKDDFSKKEETKEPKIKKKEEKKEIDLIPINKPKKVSVKRDEEEDALNAIVPFEEEDEEPHLTLPVLDDEEEDKAPILPGIPETRRGERELPPRFEDVEEEPEEDEDEEEVVDAIPYEDVDEELTPVSAMVVQPKGPLWKKIGKAIAAGTMFLSALGTAIHTGMMLKGHKNVDTNNKKEETIETTESEVKKDKTEEKIPSSAKVDEKPKEDISTKTVEKAPAKEETPVVEAKKEEKEDGYILEEGEEISNADTGVVVNYEGKAQYSDGNGNVQPLTDRNLEYNENRDAIVQDKDLEINEADKDLNKNPVPSVPFVETNETTDKKKTEEEAYANMSQDEKEVNEGIVDDTFLKFFGNMTPDNKNLEETGRSR